jgi:SAM-dependent methyltransferase
MREHNKAFCQVVAEAFPCPGPVYEFGSYQVEGQEQFADLRGLFANSPYIGCDMRQGPGVDRLEDVSQLSLGDETVGTALCIETFEHVFEVRRAFDEIYRVLKPGGLFILTSPLNFRIHGYPDDYWRMTPSCLRRMLAPYAARIVGWQGHDAFPHTVMSLGIKTPAPVDFGTQSDRLVYHYRDWLKQTERELPWSTRLKRSMGQIYRSKGERHQLTHYYRAGFQVDSAAISIARAG